MVRQIQMVPPVRTTSSSCNFEKNWQLVFLGPPLNFVYFNSYSPPSIFKAMETTSSNLKSSFMPFLGVAIIPSIHSSNVKSLSTSGGCAIIASFVCEWKTDVNVDKNILFILCKTYWNCSNMFKLNWQDEYSLEDPRLEMKHYCLIFEIMWVKICWLISHFFGPAVCNEFMDFNW